MNGFGLRDWWRSHATWRTAYLLFLGQVVSFVMALMSFTSSLIADLGKLFKTPSLISSFLFPASLLDHFWSLFCFLFGCVYCVGVDTPLTQTTFGYFVLALVYGNLLLYRRQRLKVIICCSFCSLSLRNCVCLYIRLTVMGLKL